MAKRKNKLKKVILAYSGGLDTSVAIPWIKETYDCEVIAYCADLGQGEELESVREKALATGASKVYIRDLREIFARDYIFPMLRANAVYEDGYLLGTSIARPLIAKVQMEIARKERAEGVAHGATGKGNDQVRFELAYLAIDPNIRIIAPWREWDLDSRKSLIAYSKAHDIPISATRAKPYSMDRNLFHVSYEGGILENPWTEPPEEIYLWTTSPEMAPIQSRMVEITFKAGDPVAVDGKKLSPAKLMETVNRLGAQHGIGRVDLVENRYLGIKSRGVYETPGGTILHKARRAVESITMDREVLHLRDSLVAKYAELVYNGYWFSPEREMLQTAMDAAQANVTGTARVRLYKGNCIVSGRKSPRSLYNLGLATFESGASYDHRQAEGFIRLNALRLQLNADRKK